VSGLPAGWSESTVGDLFQVVGGGTPDTSVQSNWKGEIPWISSADISGRGDISFRKSISKEAVQRSAANLVPEGSVVVVTRVGLGKVARAPRDMAFSQDCQALLPIEGIMPEFLRLQLSMTALGLKSVSRGTTISGVTKKELLNLPIVLAPSLEQPRIVAAIEEQFSRLDAGVAVLERTRENLTRMRSAVLQAAVTGQLIPDSAEHWDKRPLPTLGNLDRGKSRHRPRNASLLYGGPYPFIQTGDVTSARPWIRSFSQTYNDYGLAQSRLWPSGTLCITIAANIARTGLLAFDACFPDSVVGFVADDGPIAARWVELVLRSMQNDLERLAPATAQRNINLAILRALEIPYPDLNYQALVVEEYDRQMSLIASLDGTIAATQLQSDRLRSSILKAAFSGQLTFHDPTEEPASALIERISRERASFTGQGPRTARATWQKVSV
jgi:type I restriction enzyme, S subunit